MERQAGSPFADVDISRLDRDFPALLRRAADPSDRPGLSRRERRLFRLGILVGLGEWGAAGEHLLALLDEGLVSGPEAERAAAEAGMVKGWAACRHLAPLLAGRGLSCPAGVAEAVEAARKTDAGLSAREVFALGLGITWGAGCWDT